MSEMEESFEEAQAAMTGIRFRVEGESRPAGSKTAMPIWDPKKGDYRRTAEGRIVTRAMHGKCKTKEDVTAYMHRVGKLAREVYDGPLLEGPIYLSVRFVRPRPKSHYRTGKNAHLVKKDAPDLPISTPDSLKLARAVEDGLTGVIWRDDAQVCQHRINKDFGDHYYADVYVAEIVDGDLAHQEESEDG